MSFTLNDTGRLVLLNVATQVSKRRGSSSAIKCCNSGETVNIHYAPFEEVGWSVGWDVGIPHLVQLITQESFASASTW